MGGGQFLWESKQKKNNNHHLWFKCSSGSNNSSSDVRSILWLSDVLNWYNHSHTLKISSPVARLQQSNIGSNYLCRFQEWRRRRWWGGADRRADLCRDKREVIPIWRLQSTRRRCCLSSAGKKESGLKVERARYVCLALLTTLIDPSYTHKALSQVQM